MSLFRVLVLVPDPTDTAVDRPPGGGVIRKLTPYPLLWPCSTRGYTQGQNRARMRETPIELHTSDRLNTYADHGPRSSPYKIDKDYSV